MPDDTSPCPPDPTRTDTSVNIATAFAHADVTMANLRPVPRDTQGSPLPLAEEARRSTARPTEEEEPATHAFQKVWATPRTPANRQGGLRHRPTPSRTHQSVTFAADTQFDDSLEAAENAETAWQTVWRDTPNWVQRVQENALERRQRQDAAVVPAPKLPQSRRSTSGLRPNGGNAPVREANPAPGVTRYNLRPKLHTPRRMAYDADFQVASLDGGSFLRNEEPPAFRDSFLDSGNSPSELNLDRSHDMSFSKSGLSPVLPSTTAHPAAFQAGMYGPPAPDRPAASTSDVSPLIAVTPGPAFPGLDSGCTGSGSYVDDLPNIVDMSPYMHSERHLRTANPPLVTAVPPQPVWSAPPMPEALPIPGDNDSNAPTVVDEYEPDDRIADAYLQAAALTAAPPPRPAAANPAYANQVPATPTGPPRTHNDPHPDNASMGRLSQRTRYSDFYPDRPFTCPTHYGLSHFLADAYRQCYDHLHFTQLTLTFPIAQLLRLLHHLARHAYRSWIVAPLASLIALLAVAINRIGRIFGLPSEFCLGRPADYRGAAHVVVFLGLLLGGYMPLRRAWEAVPTLAATVRSPFYPSVTTGSADTDTNIFLDDLPELPDVDTLAYAVPSAWIEMADVVQQRLMGLERQMRALIGLEPQLQATLDTLQARLDAQDALLADQERRFVEAEERLQRGTDKTLELQAAVERGLAALPGSPAYDALVDERIHRAIRNYAADVLGLPDYALATAGARSIPLLTSPTYEAPGPDSFWRNALATLLGVPHGRPVNQPAVALDPDQTPGSCWPFRGAQGSLGVALSRPIIPTAFSLEHLSPAVALDVRSAPHQVELWAVLDHRDLIPPAEAASGAAETTGHGNEPSQVLLGVAEYQVSADSPVQTFNIDPGVLDRLQLRVHHVRAVQLRVVSNHGHPDYTCLYRLRVHAA
ncbi:hypothetical protein IWQ60_003726 [Tieghemiomyces parasiticus]|uniref:SUN domain-containing protein n=1 Tax=Tieghemiomyces parasiticus TaxID=78921 RepID=A0A9W8DZS6_9FUNG|nr:hypothetical protein IWQ60_003726 [Tieghemiomyces parasiticus]